MKTDKKEEDVYKKPAKNKAQKPCSANRVHGIYATPEEAQVEQLKAKAEFGSARVRPKTSYVARCKVELYFVIIFDSLFGKREHTWEDTGRIRTWYRDDRYSESYQAAEEKCSVCVATRPKPDPLEEMAKIKLPKLPKLKKVK